MMSPQLHVAMMDARSAEETRRAAARRDPMDALRKFRLGKSRRSAQGRRARTARKPSLRASSLG